jgi:hypothetical protein
VVAVSFSKEVAMIAITKQTVQGAGAANDRFIEMLPKIRQQARLAFRRLRPERQADLIEEVIANAYCRFVGLVRRGKADVAFATPLANYAIRHVIAGRQVGTRPNLRDVMSPQARAAFGIVVERLDRFDQDRDEWRTVLVEDRNATPADIAAARIDVAAWLRSLSRRNRRIAQILATGESPSVVARQFKLSGARISQLRNELEVSWRAYQGEETQPMRTRKASQHGHATVGA